MNFYKNDLQIAGYQRSRELRALTQGVSLSRGRGIGAYWNYS